MSEIFNQSDKPFCVNHVKTQQDIDTLKESISNIKVEIAKLQNSKVEQEEVSDIQKEISKLSAQIEAVFRDRRDDMRLIQQLRDEVASISEELRGNAVLNENIKVNQEYIIKAIKDMSEDIKNVSGEVKVINKNTNINWLELIHDLISQNIIRKIVSWGFISLFTISIIAGVVWLTTGENLFPVLKELIHK